MDVLSVAAIGVAIVLVSILVVRLHPLLGLLIGSLFVFAATPKDIQLSNELAGKIVEVSALSPSGLVGVHSASSSDTYVLMRELYAGADKGGKKNEIPLRLARATPSELSRAAEAGDQLPNGIVWFSTGSDSGPISKGAKLVSLSDLQDFEKSRWKGLGGQLAEGFAKTFRKLGIPVTMAAIVGVCLLESGAAARLVAAIMHLFGTRGTAPALTVSGFILGVPVFFDNVFYLLLPLAKAVGRKRPEQYLAAVMAIIVGATMAHSLVPPTPGPLLVCSAVGVSVGMMMMAGFIVGSLAAVVGFTYGMLCSRWIPLSADFDDSGPVARESERAIPLLLAALPIAIPIAILSGSEIVSYLATGRGPLSWMVHLQNLLQIINDPGLIFIATAILSIAILRYYSNGKTVGKAVSRGIADAGTIVLLTCAGGAFGASLQQLDLASAIGSRFAGLTTPWGLLFTAFFVTAIIRVAQGSATVAMITSAAIVAPVMESVELPFHPVYVALAIGCGSKPMPWMNDSGFWQVATMTGLTVSQTLKTFSIALTLMGLTGFGLTLLGAWLIPLR